MSNKIKPEEDLDFVKKVEKLQNYTKEKDLKIFLHWVDNKTLTIDKKITDPIKAEKAAKKDLEKYAGKKFAYVFVSTFPDHIKKDENILGIKIEIYKILKSGKLKDYNGICLNYNKEELKKITFNLKYLKSLIDLAKDGKFFTDTLFGISYNKFLKKLNDKNIDTKPFLKS